MPYIPYLPYIPNIPYFPNMPYQTDHTHHTYPPYHTTPPPHHRGGRGTVPHPHHTTGGEGEDLIWDQYMGPIHHTTGGGGGQCHTPTTPQGGRGKISYGTSIWDPSHMGGGEGGGWQGLVHTYTPKKKWNCFPPY